MIQMNLFAKHKDTDRDQTYGYPGRKGGGVNWEIGIDVYTPLIICIK